MSASSSTSIKKDLTTSAGEFASSLFDRLKKSAAERAERVKQQNQAASSSSSQQAASPAAAADLISNLAQNLISNTANTSNSSSSGISFSKLLSESKKTSTPPNKTLTVYDEEIDDSDFDVAKMNSTSKLVESSSNAESLSISTSSLSSVPSSRSELDMNLLKSSISTVRYVGALKISLIINTITLNLNGV